MRVRLAGLALALALLPAAAGAQSCAVSADRGLAFGTYDPLLGLSSPTSATLTVSCQVTGGLVATLLGKSIPYTVKLTSANGRQMLGPSGGRLSYLLASDAAMAQTWSDGTLVGGTIPLVGTLLSGLLSGSGQTRVYGAVQPGQRPPAGAYNDTLVVEVTY